MSDNDPIVTWSQGHAMDARMKSLGNSYNEHNRTHRKDRRGAWREQSASQVHSRRDLQGHRELRSKQRLVGFSGFGKFKVKVTPEREGRNPASGEKIKIAASRKLTFSSAKSVKDILNG